MMIKRLRSAGLPTVCGNGRGTLRFVASALVMLLVMIAALPERLAAAETLEGKPDIWLVTIGGWAIIEPSFEGARDFSFGGRPILAIRREGAKDWLTLPKDSFDIELVETERFRAGPVASWHFQRDVGSVPRGFQQVGKIDLSVEAGGFIEYWPADALRTRLEVRHSIIGGKGLVADFSADAIWRPSKAVLVTGGPRVSVADSDFMRTYYGVDAAQASFLNLPAHSAQAGLRSYGAGSMLKYFWSDQWATMTYAEYARLSGDAGDSPLIGSHNGTKDQFTVGIGTSYTFSVGR